MGISYSCPRFFSGILPTYKFCTPSMLDGLSSPDVLQGAVGSLTGGPTCFRAHLSVAQLHPAVRQRSLVPSPCSHPLTVSQCHVDVPCEQRIHHIWPHMGKAPYLQVYASSSTRFMYFIILYIKLTIERKFRHS